MIPPPDASEKKGPGDRDSQDKEQNFRCTTLPGSLIGGGGTSFCYLVIFSNEPQAANRQRGPAGDLSEDCGIFSGS